MGREKGIITSWNDEKGYGFVSPVAGGKPVFAHIKDFRGNLKQGPALPAEVSYNVSTDHQGRICAIYIELARSASPESGVLSKVFVSSIVFILYFAVLCTVTLLDVIPEVVLAWYLIFSFISYLVYYRDKVAAQSGNWRTPEKNLHVLALVGGWPGALMAQQRLRHKCRKASFQIVYWLTVLVNCSVLVWLCTPQGATYFKHLLGVIS